MSKTITVEEVEEGQYIRFVYHDKVRVGLVIPNSKPDIEDRVFTMHIIEKEGYSGIPVMKSFKKKEIASAIELLD